MANKILKGLALAAGTGVALGFSASLGQQRKSNADTDLEEIKRQLQRQAKEIAAIERQLANASAELPAAIEAAVTPRVEELRGRLRMEMREAAANGVAQIDRASDDRLASRIATLEQTLSDQSGAIGSLSERALETDANLQKLISSVERLCDRTDARPAAEPSFLDLPFQTQYEAALQSESTTPPRMFIPSV